MILQASPAHQLSADDAPHLIPATDLPVEDVVDDVRRALAEGKNAILVAPPGAGKTTLIPLRLIDQPWMDDQRIVMLEPRRLAARAAAQRLAGLIGQRPGDLVGYQTRDERVIGSATRIEVVTEGILTRRLQGDPTLSGVGLVIFDEVHERHLPTDLGLAFALDVQRTVRPDLRILAMSATAEADKLATLLGDPAPVVTSSGRQYPVEIVWAPPKKGERPVDASAAVIVRALREHDGDVLVFLPGIGEIRRVQRLLEAALPPNLADNVDILGLAGAMSLDEQDRALRPSPKGRRRVVLSTDIAETSLTVDGVCIVVDAGLARTPVHDARSGMTRLTTIPTSRASAEQRSGRAGRQTSGVAYRLWSKLEHGSRRAHLDPEIQRVDLAGMALEVAQWGTPLEDLRFADPPPRSAMQQATSLLHMLGALDEADRPTAAGRRILAIPVHPRLAHMISAAPNPHRNLACLLGALLDERDVFSGRPDDLPADIGLRVDVLTGRIHDERADRRSVARIRDRARDLARRAGIDVDGEDSESDASGALLLLAYPDRLAMRRQPGQFQMRTGSAAWCPPRDPLAREAFLVAADVDGDRKNARIRLAAAVREADIVDVLRADVRTDRAIAWDRERRDVMERVVVRLDRMRLSESVQRPRPGPETTAVIVEHITKQRLSPLPWTAASQQLRNRVAFLHREVGEPWPGWSDGDLIDDVDRWLTPFLAGITSMTEVEQLDMTLILRSLLPWPEGAQLDELAPRELTTPSGRTLSIDYEQAMKDGTAPIVRVRVQDLFGLAVHPTVLGGRVPLVLHLLSPADRPIQITADLPSFWRGSWSEVRKDMAGRYPKHQWPLDPATADPKRLKDR